MTMLNFLFTVSNFASYRMLYSPTTRWKYSLKIDGLKLNSFIINFEFISFIYLILAAMYRITAVK